MERRAWRIRIARASTMNCAGDCRYAMSWCRPARAAASRIDEILD